jgi:hypothetical protein
MIAGEARFFAFRVPALPIETLTTWADDLEAPHAGPNDLRTALDHDRSRLRAQLHDITSRPGVRGAISVASPDLLDAVDNAELSAKVEAALIRYVSRMASRPTPFGLFAACGSGVIAARTCIRVPDRVHWRRHTRLDGDYLDRIVRDRTCALRQTVSYRATDSLYEAGAGRFRYVETRLNKLERTHHLAEIADSPHLQRALDAASSGATAEQIDDAVAAGGIDHERATRYVDELIESQVLLPMIAVTITGPQPLAALIADLGAAGDTGAASTLGAVREHLSSIDAEGMNAPPARDAQIAAMLEGLPPPETRATLLQVDASIPDCGATLSRSLVDDALRAVDLLRRIAPVPEPTEFERFRDAFVERYEEREVPLLEALDNDLGPGFGGGGDPAPLIKGLPRPKSERKVQMGRRETRLLELLHRAWTRNGQEVVLTCDDMADLERHDAPPLPYAFHVTASIARTRDGDRLVLPSAGGPSGANLLGRFCHGDAGLLEHVRAHLRAEEAVDPDAAYAEIVHLPSGRLSNILVRPLLRDWELEWLGRSGAAAEQRIAASDLLVSVRNGAFVLRSRRLRRRVVPRLTSAHNWSRRSPALYRFLAAMQSQGTIGGVEWSWAPCEQVPFTPRVRWGRIVLAVASWRLTQTQLRVLDERDDVARWTAVQTLRERARLPRWVVLAEGDNKLALDLDNALSVDTFVRETRGRHEVRLEEMCPAQDETAVDEPDGLVGAAHASSPVGADSPLCAPSNWALPTSVGPPKLSGFGTKCSAAGVAPRLDTSKLLPRPLAACPSVWKTGTSAVSDAKVALKLSPPISAKCCNAAICPPSSVCNRAGSRSGIKS